MCHGISAPYYYQCVPGITGPRPTPKPVRHSTSAYRAGPASSLPASPLLEHTSTAFVEVSRCASPSSSISPLRFTGIFAFREAHECLPAADPCLW